MGEVLKRPGRRAEVLADLEQLDVLEFTVDAETDGAGPHFHAEHADTFVVLEGELQVLTAGEPVLVRAGESAAAPPGTVHGFRNVSPEPVRFLNVHAPSQRFVEYLRRMDAGEELDATAYDMHEPDGAPGGSLVVSAGERFDRGNALVTIAVDLPQLSVNEIAFGPSFVVDPHEHDDHVDSFYVLEGEVEFTRGDGTFRTGPQTFYAATPGLRHGFRTPGPGSARILNFHAPDAGFSDSIRRR